MILTEEEAKTKRCQETFGNQAYPPGPCIASACMAWRWLPHYVSGAPSNDGYCGKAGKP